MSDIYESKLLELTASITYNKIDPYGAVLPEDMRIRFDSMKQLNYNCMIANQMRDMNIEFSDHLISWIKTELKNIFIYRIGEKIKHDKSENIFYNIVFCIISRWKFWRRCDSRSHVISKDKFCELIGKNRKTLSRQCTLKYTDQHLSEIWASVESPDALIQTYSDLRNLINEIAETLRKKVFQ